MTTRRIHLALAFVLLATALSGCAFEQRESVDVAGDASAITGRPYFRTWQSDSGKHYFHLRAANHEIILASQGYSTRAAALSGVLSVMDNGVDRGRYQLREAVNGSFYFTLHAANGQVIGTSETYGQRWSASRGIDTVVRNVDTYLDWLANRTAQRFDVFRGADDRFYFNLIAKNGEIVLSSQGYDTEAAALNGVFSVADNGVDAARYDVRPSADGGFYFNLKAGNGRVIGTSEVYASRYNAERAVDSIIALLPTVELL